MVIENRMIPRLGAASLAMLLCLDHLKAVPNSVSLAWDPSPDSNVTGYILHYGTIKGGTYPTPVDVGKVISATISTLTPGVRYYFVVTAYDSSRLESQNSQEVAFTSPLQVTLPFAYEFSGTATITQAGNSGGSYDPYWWIASGGGLFQGGGVATTFMGPVSSANYWCQYYSLKAPLPTDTGVHPQNIFAMYLRQNFVDILEDIYVKKSVDNIANAVNRRAYNGITLVARYSDYANFYCGSIRADGFAIIKKRVAGIYTTLASRQVFPGTYSALANPSLIPTEVWIGMRLVVATQTSGISKVSLYTDVGRTGKFTLATEALDDPSVYGTAVTSAGMVGVKSDMMDMSFDSFKLDVAPTSSLSRALTVQSLNESIALPAPPTNLRIIKPGEPVPK